MEDRVKEYDARHAEQDNEAQRILDGMTPSRLILLLFAARDAKPKTSNVYAARLADIYLKRIYNDND